MTKSPLWTGTMNGKGNEKMEGKRFVGIMSTSLHSGNRGVLALGASPLTIVLNYLNYYGNDIEA